MLKIHKTSDTNLSAHITLSDELFCEDTDYSVVKKDLLNLPATTSRLHKSLSIRHMDTSTQKVPSSQFK